jgi:molybdenum cofactor guanylyltransferase
MCLAGFVLVGGNSIRMGRDKARLPVDSHLLIEDVVSKVAFVAQNVTLVGAAERYGDLPFDRLSDLRSGNGPLGGIETALAADRCEFNLIVACDLPNLRKEWLAALKSKAIRDTVSCVVCKDRNDVVQPLCGVWHRSCLPVVRNAIDCGRLRMMDLLQELSAETVEVEGIISNVNTPEEWRTWQTAHGPQTPQLS